jgi:uncharacterized protein YqjF (DUF2071 family)
MHQNWGKLLFMHWQIEPDLLRPLIPPVLKLDTFDGSAWIGITPFTMWDIRAFPPFVPPFPGLSSMHELNVRTYVEFQGTPGVWFFSLDVNSYLAALAARTLFYLPYHAAEIALTEAQNQIDYYLQRRDESRAEFHASWKVGEKLPCSLPGTREYFLTERYCLYSEHNGRLYRARIHHKQWPLQQAQLIQFKSNILDATNVLQPAGEPLVLYSEEVSVDIWLLEMVSRNREKPAN